MIVQIVPASQEAGIFFCFNYLLMLVYANTIIMVIIVCLFIFIRGYAWLEENILELILFLVKDLFL